VARLRAAGWPLEVRVLGGADPTPAGAAHERELRRRIEELGVGAVVSLDGPRSQPEVLRAMHECHLFVAAAVETPAGDKDGIPTALFEGIPPPFPVVPTTAGSIPEAITAGVDGELVPPGDPAALAGAILGLLADPDRRRRLGTAAAATVRRRFDAAHCEEPLHQRIRALALAASGGTPGPAGKAGSPGPSEAPPPTVEV
jgi:glycosyltransferase involved in cell wall biosynthesis